MSRGRRPPSLAANIATVARAADAMGAIRRAVAERGGIPLDFRLAQLHADLGAAVKALDDFQYIVTVRISRPGRPPVLETYSRITRRQLRARLAAEGADLTRTKIEKIRGRWALP